MSKTHRCLALVPYPAGRAPGQRYRIEQWIPYLREQGISVELLPFSSDVLADALYRPHGYLRKAWLMGQAWFGTLRKVLHAGEFESVFLYREAALVGPALLERVIRRRIPRLIYDFDDAIWLRYVSPRNHYLSYLKFPSKTRTICRLAAAVVVGNEHLARFARRYNSCVTIVPSTVSLREYRPATVRPRASERVIGWTGSHSSIQYLKVVEGALQRLAQRRRFRLRVVGVHEVSIPGVSVECVPWAAATEVEDLWPLDVGIMPLTEDPWTLGKCAMKAIQYLAIGVPAVVSPVGANREVVEHGITGFHARTEDEWAQALERCLDDEALRLRMGAAGRSVVEARYSAEAQVPHLAAVLKGV